MMKLITWNCQKGGWRNKKNKENLIKPLNPDIAVIQDCEYFDNCDANNLWFGDGPISNGIGVFSYSDYSFKVHREYDTRYKHIVPIEVRGKDNFILFAIWTKIIGYSKATHIAQVWSALNRYKHLLVKPIIIAGDFNWWVSSRRDRFVDIVSVLRENCVKSAYHTYYKEEFGKETRFTQYHRGHTRANHLDYCFMSGDFLSKLQYVRIGYFTKWSQYSDHFPLMVTIK